MPRSAGALLMILFGFVLMSLALLRFQTNGSVIPLLALSALLLGAIVIINPTIGVYATLFAAGFVRLTVSTGTQTPVVASLGCAGVVCAGWLIHQILHRKPIVQPPAVIAFPALGIMGFMTFALFWGRATLDPRIFYYNAFLRVQLSELGLVIITCTLILVGADVFARPLARHVLLGVLVFIGLLHQVLSVFIHNVPVLGVGGLFGMWFVAITWSHALVNKSLPRAVRALLGLAAIIFIVDQFIFQRSWVSGWLPVVVVFVAITTLVRPRIGLASLALIVGYFFVFSNQASLIWQSEESQGSAAGNFGRVELWRRNLQTLGNDVILGTGPVTYALYYMTFEPTEAMSTHNNYIDILDESGVPGLASLLGLLGGLMLVGRRLRRQALKPSDQALTLTVMGGVAGVAVAMLFGDWVIPFVYNQTLAGFDHAVYTWLMFGALAGLAVQMRRTNHSHA